MWCTTCNIETNEETCPICGSNTVEDVPIEVYWCKTCETPIIRFANQIDKDCCPLCNGKAQYFVSDLRPVFPEERLLIAILLNKSPDYYMNKSVWASSNRYYIDGKPQVMSNKVYENADV